jgi:hypothetical protein
VSGAIVARTKGGGGHGRHGERWLPSGTRQAGPRGSNRGAGESGKERLSGDGAPIGGPGQHSAGAAVQTVF